MNQSTKTVLVLAALSCAVRFHDGTVKVAVADSAT